MTAYKFLREGAVGPFSGFPWPTPKDGQPGPWVEGGREVAVCRRGIHACRASDLPWWLQVELWEVELAGQMTSFEHKVSAPRGRLLRQIDAWDADVREEYAHACAWRARNRAVEALERSGEDERARELAGCATLDDLLQTSRQLASAVPEARISLTIAGDGATNAITRAVATSAYIAAQAAGRIDGPAGVFSERAWQAAWLAERLRL